MALLMPAKFEQICRACMTDCVSFYSLLDYVDDSRGEKIQIYELLNRTVPELPKIEIINDELPKNICTGCVEKACAFFEFQYCCISSDIQLRKLIGHCFEKIDESLAETTDPLNNHYEVKSEVINDETLTDKNQEFINNDDDCNTIVKNISLEHKDENSSKNTNSLKESFKETDQEHMQIVHTDDDIKTSNTEPNTLNIDLVNNKKDECDETSSSSYSTNKVEKIVSKRSWSCEKCNKPFTRITNYKKHMFNIHKEDKKQIEAKLYSLKCDKCDDVFKHKTTLKKHMKLHENPGNLKKVSKMCELCDKCFSTNLKLFEHYITIHPERIKSNELPVPEALKRILCPYCKKISKHLAGHILTHTKERPFLCSDCGKGFTSNSSLSQHMLRHTNEKRYACKECPKRFTCVSDLCSHRFIHTNVRPHICDLCGSAFKTLHELNVHKRNHGVRKYKCEYCAKDFTGIKHLSRHILTHTGEKPYKCEYCPRSFAQSNDMIKHLRTHLGNNVYQCELCPAAFDKAGKRRAHFSSHNNDDEETKERNKRALHEAQEKLRKKLQLNENEEKDTATNSNEKA